MNDSERSESDSPPDREDREMVEAIRRRVAARDDLDELDFVAAVLEYAGVDPDDVVLIKDPEAPQGYEVVDKAEFLSKKEDAATASGFMSRYLRYEADYSPWTVAKMDLAELTAAFRREIDDDGGE